MRIGNLEVTFEQLQQALGLPSGTRIVSIDCGARESACRVVHIYVEHRALSDIQSTTIPRVIHKTVWHNTDGTRA